MEAANPTKNLQDLAHTDDSDSGSDTGFVGVRHIGSGHGQDRVFTKTTILLITTAEQSYTSHASVVPGSNLEKSCNGSCQALVNCCCNLGELKSAASCLVQQAVTILS